MVFYLYSRKGLNLSLRKEIIRFRLILQLKNGNFKAIT